MVSVSTLWWVCGNILYVKLWTLPLFPTPHVNMKPLVLWTQKVSMWWHSLGCPVLRGYLNKFRDLPVFFTSHSMINSCIQQWHGTLPDTPTYLIQAQVAYDNFTPAVQTKSMPKNLVKPSPTPGIHQEAVPESIETSWSSWIAEHSCAVRTWYVLPQEDKSMCQTSLVVLFNS